MAGRFVPRPIRPTGLAVVGEWRLKGYEVTPDGQPVWASIVEAVDIVLQSELPRPASGEHGIGFVVIHPGELAVWVLVGLWTGDIVCQHTFRASLDDPSNFERVPVGGPTACVFELPVHAHESIALIKHILDPAEGPNVEAFLRDFLDTTNG